MHLIFNFALRVKCFSHFVDEEDRGWRGQSLVHRHRLVGGGVCLQTHVCEARPLTAGCAACRRRQGNNAMWPRLTQGPSWPTLWISSGSLFFICIDWGVALERCSSSGILKWSLLERRPCLEQLEWALCLGPWAPGLPAWLLFRDSR